MSDAFCAQSRYRSGFRDVSLYMLLDKSSSMLDADKWDQAAAALGAFVDDPAVAGLEFGLQYYPLGANCASQPYAIPAHPIAPLPGHAAQIKSSLATQQPEGDTPTLPALRGGIEHARAKQVAEPDQAVAVALLTDGWPNACDSTAERLVSLASEGANTAPQVLTFVIGFRTGRLSVLDQVAAAGGTGHAVVIGDDGTAQQLVDTLKSVREGLQDCRFAVPPVVGVPTAADVAVSYELEPETPGVPLPRVADAARCEGAGFYFVPTGGLNRVQLCPASCALLHGSEESSVVVTVGCGAGYQPPDGGVDGGGDCGGAVSFGCVEQCGASSSPPVCQGGLWGCPAGTVPTYSCTSCQAVPHRCCRNDGTLAAASCIDGEWICPPGTVLFGDPSCRPPAVCAAELPCAGGQYCVVSDYSCGEQDISGSCQPIPTSCEGLEQPVCGCDGATYPSACSAASGGVDLSDTHSCPAPAGTFPCGPLFCRVSDQLCKHTDRLAAQPGQRHGYECVPEPPACPTGCGCDLCEPCPPDTTCAESCSVLSGGRVVLCTQL